MKKYKSIFKKFNEGMDSVPEVEKAIIKFIRHGYLVSDIFGSFASALQDSNRTDMISNKTWRKCLDLYSDIAADEEKEQE